MRAQSSIVPVASQARRTRSDGISRLAAKLLASISKRFASGETSMAEFVTEREILPRYWFGGIDDDAAFIVLKKNNARHDIVIKIAEVNFEVLVFGDDVFVRKWCLVFGIVFGGVFFGQGANVSEFHGISIVIRNARSRNRWDGASYRGYQAKCSRELILRDLRLGSQLTARKRTERGSSAHRCKAPATTTNYSQRNTRKAII